MLPEFEAGSTASATSVAADVTAGGASAAEQEVLAQKRLLSQLEAELSQRPTPRDVRAAGARTSFSKMGKPATQAKPQMRNPCRRALTLQVLSGVSFKL